MSKSPPFSFPALQLALIYLVAIFAGFVAPYPYQQQHRDAPLTPSFSVRAVGNDGDTRIVSLWSILGPGQDDAPNVSLQWLVRDQSYSILGLFDSDVHLFGVTAPNHVFILGTDRLGRDLFSRLIYGGQISLGAGLVGAGLALMVALVLGCTAGYFGGWLDVAVSRAVDACLSLPWLYLLLAARAFLPLDLDAGSAFLLVVCLLGLVGWAGPARLFQKITAVARHKGFVSAAQTSGANHLTILRTHIVPQLYTTIGTQAAILIPVYMLAEVTLSFVGLGVSEPVPSWGNMLALMARSASFRPSFGMLAPAIALMCVTLLFQTLLSALRSNPDEQALAQH